MKIILLLIISLLLTIWSCKSQNKSDAVRIQKERTSVKSYLPYNSNNIKASALVIHGLNNNPRSMIPLIRNLQEWGINTLAVELQGHGNNYKRLPNENEEDSRMASFQSATRSLWLNEIKQSYLTLKQKAAHKPIYLVAYSLGGLLSLDLINQNKEIRFDKVVYFAPAIRVNTGAKLFGFLKYGPNFVIPSFTPEDYRANNGTPVSAYLALLHSIDTLAALHQGRVNRPTLLFIHKEDELVDYKLIQTFIKDHQLSNWNLSLIDKDLPPEQESYNHLIIDPANLGPRAWSQVIRQMKQHLQGSFIDPATAEIDRELDIQIQSQYEEY